MTKRYLIINCDDFGQCRAANEAIFHLLEAGKVSSATIMPPAPAFTEAAAWARSRKDPQVGLHLTFTSEYDGHRWKSLTGDPSLHDESGYMHMTIKEFEERANPQAVRAEMQAQFRAVAESGLNVTHVDNHMGSLYGLATGRSYLPQVFRECGKRGLPFRIFRNIYEKDALLASIPNAAGILAKVVALADVLGVAMPDYLLTHTYPLEEGETYDSFKQMLIRKVYDLPEGVSETYIHPAVEDEELKSFLPSWQKRVWEFELMQDDDFAYAIKDASVVLTDYRYVRDHLGRSRLKAALQLLKTMLRK
ncbi:polysaccharide deacetylase family protein [Paenibacillus sp. MBLB4367]|uniref:polysaccharide deacetylase family protein n=1 Tax=Paenibacillus sp. MBLB4367 TaxID=3384767 RepID=UPI003907FA8B